MMKLGVDIVAVDRIERALSQSGESFYQRVLTPDEQREIGPVESNVQRMAGLWAAKEAAVKALGTGFRCGITFHDIEIQHDASGCPRYHFSGAFLKLANAQNIQSATLSISHCAAYAVAVAALT